MKVVKLGKSKHKEPEEARPGLPAVELVYSVNDCADKQLDC